MNEPFISLIVPVKNAQRTLDITFDYLIKLDYPKEKMELIVADGDSTDDTVAIVKKWQSQYPYIQLVHSPNSPSPGHARNDALKVAKGEIILFTDGDCAPNANWVRLMLEPFFTDPNIGGVGGEIHTLRIAPDSIVESYCEQTGFLSVKSRSGLTKEGYLPQLSDMSPSQASAHRAPFFATANAAYRKVAIDKVGGFWDHPTGEDVGFSVDIQLAGYRLYFKPSAIVLHMHRITEEAFLFQWFGYGQGHAFLVEKHATRHFELVFQIFNGLPRIKIPSPIKGLVYIGNYHMIWIGGFLTLLSTFITLLTHSKGWAGFTIFSVLLLLHYLYRYFKGCFSMAPRSLWATWCRIRWQTNTSFIKGGLDGTKRTGILYIEPSW